MTSLPTVMTKAGLTPQTPSAIRAELISSVEDTVPGYTANLPGSLIEDMSSTEVGGIAQIDAARVDLVNSLTPYGANEFILNQLGQMIGIQPGEGFNVSVYLVFSGTVGYVVSDGFVVSDGTHQYRVKTGGIIGSGGVSQPLFAVATIAGDWAVPEETVTSLITSVPSSISLSVTNPQDGIPSSGEESTESYRTRVLEAERASAQGMATFMKTLIKNVLGVQPRLVSVRKSGSDYMVIVGGGDPYEVGYAIFKGDFFIPGLVGSTISITDIDQAATAQITTDLNHGKTPGDEISVSEIVAGMTEMNGGPYEVLTVIDQTNFTIDVDSTMFTAYTSGGIVTPNDRNIVVSILDYPDTYNIPFVNPPQQEVLIGLLWNTTATNAISDDSVQQAGALALANYVNLISAGGFINLFQLESVFKDAVSNLIPAALLSRMVFTVTIDGVVTAPDAGTGVIDGDPESYFQTDTTKITIARG